MKASRRTVCQNVRLSCLGFSSIVSRVQTYRDLTGVDPIGYWKRKPCDGKFGVNLDKTPSNFVKIETTVSSYSRRQEFLLLCFLPLHRLISSTPDVETRSNSVLSGT